MTTSMRVTVTDKSGDVTEVEGAIGLSLMEVLRDAGVDDEIGMCGGCCSCASCHVYVNTVEGDGFPSASEAEDELLSSLGSKTPKSRLACQLELSAGLIGVNVDIAPSEE